MQGAGLILPPPYLGLFPVSPCTTTALSRVCLNSKARSRLVPATINERVRPLSTRSKTTFLKVHNYLPRSRILFSYHSSQYTVYGTFSHAFARASVRQRATRLRFDSFVYTTARYTYTYIGSSDACLGVRCTVYGNYLLTSLSPYAIPRIRIRPTVRTLDPSRSLFTVVRARPSDCGRCGASILLHCP